ncbi:acyl-CoA dehydrogenase family protein [Pseudomonas sp. NPDC090755]|uniref:acyl-CoA dehydrogenase family protein n=1 Tax=Pseudomonas sp. NPDC090755 TaxID=3364481 RepID=UPI00383BE6C5
MIPRTLFSAEHEAYRRTVKRFLDEQVLPFHEQWEEEHRIPREVWRSAGELGLILPFLPEAYGGVGTDKLFEMILIEEFMGSGASGLIGFGVHSLVAGYLNNYATEEMKQRWLPGMISGEVIGAVAMTEPNTGSDLQAVKTRAVRDGDEYVLNGSKTFISNGTQCDFALVVCKTGETGKSGDITLILVEADRPGFERSTPLKKVGLHAQDTSMLFFDNVRVPASNVLGGVEGQGFGQLMRDLAWERMSGAIGFQAQAEAALCHTLDYTKGRTVFGKPIIDFQNSRFKLAELKTQIQLGRSWVDRCMELALRGELSAEAAAAAKYWTGELSNRVVDDCLQLHGGNGYMLEYPIARLYRDVRGNRIWGGTTEIMKEIISRTL